MLSTPLAEAGPRSPLRASPERLQALFIQRLVNYVSWPDVTAPEEGQPFIIAATDAASLRPYFQGPEVSKRFRLVQWPAKDFHILVLNNVSRRQGAALLRRTEGLPILSITQGAPNFRAGAAINFRRIGGKLALTINPKAVHRAGLSVSSKLLRIARIYKEKP